MSQFDSTMDDQPQRLSAKVCDSGRAIHIQLLACMLHVYSTNSIVISGMGFFVHSKEYIQLHDFACVFPCESKAKIKYFVIEKVIVYIR